MGGRGTFAADNSVPYNCQTVDSIEGVKVLRKPLTRDEFKKYKKFFRGSDQMTGMTIGEFIDKVFYGDEIEFMLDGVTYFIQ